MSKDSSLDEPSDLVSGSQDDGSSKEDGSSQDDGMSQEKSSDLVFGSQDNGSSKEDGISHKDGMSKDSSDLAAAEIELNSLLKTCIMLLLFHRHPSGYKCSLANPGIIQTAQRTMAS